MQPESHPKTASSQPPHNPPHAPIYVVPPLSPTPSPGLIRIFAKPHTSARAPYQFPRGRSPITAAAPSRPRLPRVTSRYSLEEVAAIPGKRRFTFRREEGGGGSRGRPRALFAAPRCALHNSAGAAALVCPLDFQLSARASGPFVSDARAECRPPARSIRRGGRFFSGRKNRRGSAGSRWAGDFLG